MKRTTCLIRALSLACLLPALTGLAAAQSSARSARPAGQYPAPQQGDYVIRDFKFKTGEALPELKLHYTTLGAPARDRSGVVRNAVLVMHGTGGAGSQFLTPQFAGVLFGPGQLLDASRYFIILPDGIGHGGSSKPSDGLHAHFPHYTYDDMVAAQYRLLTEKLGVNHLRLVMGTSMGGMQTWVWGETYPDFMDALMPLASLPVEIGGRNRVMRRIIRDAIEGDPAWAGGEYKAQPRQGLTAAVNILLMMTSSPLQWQKQAPTRNAADRFYEERLKAQLARADANDMLYQFDASREYNPSPGLETIKAPLLAINSADDLVNPPELGIMEREIKRVSRGRYVLIPVGDETRGHGTHSLPAIWQRHLAALLEESAR
jgi:homoserine O-acetyltransferase/O-succinyltransferase